MAGLGGSLYATEIRSVEERINKLLLELSTFFALNLLCLKGARLVAQKTQGAYSCLQAAVAQTTPQSAGAPTVGNGPGRGRWTLMFIQPLAFLRQTAMAQVVPTLAIFFFF